MWFYALATLPIELLTASYSFFLLILTSVYLPLVGLEGYCCTLSYSVTRTRARAHTHTHTHIHRDR